MVQSNTCRHQGDGDGIHADINPPLAGNTEVEVERQTEQEAPCGHGTLTTGNRCVVESRPGVVDHQATKPISNGLVLIDGPGAESDEASASGDEDGVAKNLVVEAVLGFTEGGVGGFKGEQASPRDVVVGVNHADHVQCGQQQAPKAHAHHDGRIHRNLSRAGLAVRIVAHAPCDLRTAFKHTETAEDRTSPLPHNEVW